MSIYENAKHVYIVNSRNRLSGTHSDFTYRFDFPSDFTPDHVGVMQMSIPKSYYTFGNDETFWVGEHQFLSSEWIERPCTYPTGNYSMTQMIVETERLLNVPSSPYQYNISIANATQVQTGKLTFEVKWVWVPQYDLAGIPIIGAPLVHQAATGAYFRFEKKVFERLGFETNSHNYFQNDLYHPLTHILIDYPMLTSVNVIKLQAEDTLMLLSDICMDSPNGLLQEIFTNVYDFGVISFTSPDLDLNSKRITRSCSNVYRFTLTNEDRENIQLNGLNLVFSLLFFSKNQTDTLTANDILLKNMEQLQNSNAP